MTPINWAARYFAVGFAAQAGLLVVFGVVLNRLKSGRGFHEPRRHRHGRVCAVRSAAVRAACSAGPWIQMEIFGLMPDPTVAATLGALLTMRRAPWSLLVIPLLWCALTGATLWTMEAPDALLMPAIAVLTIGLTASRR